MRTLAKSRPRDEEGYALAYGGFTGSIFKMWTRNVQLNGNLPRLLITCTDKGPASATETATRSDSNQSICQGMSRGELTESEEDGDDKGNSLHVEGVGQRQG